MPTAAAVPARLARQMLVALVLLALPGGCAVFRAPQTMHGNRVDQYRLEELTPGTSTQADVTALIGSPTAKATFDANTWLYISETTHTRIGRTPGVDDQAVVALRFDDKGVLLDISKRSDADGLPVSVVARATPSPGTSASFMQQLFGNMGRFNTGAPVGPSAGSGGGSPVGISGQ